MIFVVNFVNWPKKQSFEFMKLYKVYDSVLKEVLWGALKKLGVPDVLVEIVRSFHTDRCKRMGTTNCWMRLKLTMVCVKVAQCPPLCSIF